MKEITAHVKNEKEMGLLVGALIGLGYERVGGADLKTYMELYSEHKCLGLDSRGRLWSMGHEPKGGVAWHVFLAEAAKRKAEDPLSLKLNDTYDATYTKDTVTVGCQTFEADTILKLADNIKALKELLDTPKKKAKA